ncbi:MULTISPECIES: hypothetical protein [Burkholderiaceae]|uniref:hypothetical protein n=1 Tax=Burkholderiaceae TaxID=119060 RepID=UPI001424496C|nr:MULTISPECIES: hypothetical protein [Burkholderiaceae]MBN3846763.1 hypothetical protein [Paraburkholderia sp. Ac-20342]
MPAPNALERSGDALLQATRQASSSASPHAAADLQFDTITHTLCFAGSFVPSSQIL